MSTSCARILAGAVGCLLLLAGCSSSPGGKIDYRSSGAIAPLEIPPELTIPTADVHYYVPAAGKAASAPAGVPSDPALQAKLATVLPAVDRVRVEHFGGIRWLVVGETPDKLWPLVKGFWREQGLPIMLEIPEVGVMETEWGENRLKRAQSLFGKVADALSLIPERDKYRTRFERTADGKGTEIFVSHRGVVERYTYDGYPRSMFVPRPTDTELEREFLYRLMVRLGASESVARAGLALPDGARAKQGKAADGTRRLELFETFDRAWRRVGLVLDRASFVVEDRDRRQGVYFVRYVAVDVVPNDQERGAPPAERPAAGDAAKSQPWQYRVQIRQEGDNSLVRVLDRAGAPDNSPTAQRIVEQLYEQLK